MNARVNHSEPQLPLDVHLMQALTKLLWVLLVVGLFAALALWMTQRQAFAIAGISVHGQTQHNGVATLRANVVPKLKGNFFTLDVQQTQRSFEQVPWVRSAVVQRDFPNRLRVRLGEHVAVALYGPESESRIVNDVGEVFVANVGDITEDMPRLIGPEPQVPQMLKVLGLVSSALAQLDLGVEQLELTARGTWRLELDNGAVVSLGRSDEAGLQQSLGRFVHSLTRACAVWGKQPKDLESADLRYSNGFAMRLRGVTTQIAPSNAGLAGKT